MKTANFLSEKLEELAKPISGPNDIKSVAAISAGNNDEIGQMIADAIEKVGADGVLSIENGSGLETVGPAILLVTASNAFSTLVPAHGRSEATTAARQPHPACAMKARSSGSSRDLTA